jgi:ABC-type Fe3+-hydroxamate transport system substrate-binding protein
MLYCRWQKGEARIKRVFLLRLHALRAIVIALALILAACVTLYGCVGAPLSQSGAAAPEAIPESSVTDGPGGPLALPENPGEVTIASVYAVAVPFFVALRLCDRVVAVNVKSRFWTDAVEPLASAGTVGRGAVDMEALAELAPGVLVHRSNDTATAEAVSGRLGIPVFCIAVESVDDVKTTLYSMGRYFGAEERASEVSAWLDGKFAMIREIVAQIPESERVTALVMGGEPGRIAGGDMLQSWMIQQAGGICVSADISGNRNWANVGVETIFAWNPDFLFLTSSTVLEYAPESLTDDPAWSGMQAIQSGRVNQIPARIDSWDIPGMSCALGTMYLLHKMYPSYFGAEELEREIGEYYKFMFGRAFDSDYLGYDLGA